MWKPRRNFPKAIRDLAERELKTRPLGWWWLSFVDDSKPEGLRFVGVAIVEGHGVASATINADKRGINPGGSVQADELVAEAIPPEPFRNRLLTEAERIEADLV